MKTATALLTTDCFLTEKEWQKLEQALKKGTVRFEVTHMGEKQHPTDTYHSVKVELFK